MKILIVDRDETAAHFLQARLAPLGLEAQVIQGKQEAVESLAATPVDVVFLDPAPLKDARQLVLSVRRKLPTYTYIVLMGVGIGLAEAMSAGANDALAKPLDPEAVSLCVAQGQRLLTIQRRLNDPSDDYPSGGGVIAKSAFCQLFLSAIDRADRYAERSSLMLINLRNYTQIKVNDSDYAASVAAAALAKQLARIRRQSDILAQTGLNEYAVLLQRPAYDTESAEAALRFADTLSRSKDLAAATTGPIEVTVSLVEIPTGALRATHDVLLNG